ncbi:MAG: thioesterase family protein [Candidatus Limnocylindrales bacterium]
MTEAIFIPQGGGRYLATGVARGPWDENAQHGGAPASLLAHAFEELPTVEGLEIARITYELVRPVPLRELIVRAEVVRPGRRVQLMEASIITPDEVEVVRARALSVQRARDVPGEALASDRVPPLPEAGRANDYPPQAHELFALDGVELRFVSGTFREPGPSTAWFRLRLPVVQGAEPTPLQRMTAAADFGNGISAPFSWDEYLFINPDLTLYVEREPVGEWVCLEATTRISEGGIGLSESVMYDERGRIGRALQSLLVARR